MTRAQIQIKNAHFLGGRFVVYEPGDDLLSHGEAPHYHRRCAVSLLSSGWDQVVPTLYGRQAKGFVDVGLMRLAAPFRQIGVVLLGS